MSTSLTRNISTLTRDGAFKLAAATQRAAEELGIKVAVAVVDAGGHLVAFDRPDGAPFLVTDIAIDKAWTAASFGLSTHTWNQVVRDPVVAPLAGHPRLTPVGGGLPVIVDGQVVGGIGISGGTADQDHQAGEMALKSLGFDVKQ